MSGLRVAVTAKQFGTAPVLADIAFELAAGERAALIGPSGIGKTTLLSLIAGLDSAFGGQITRPPGALAMVFQTPRLLPWRTLAQNITLAHPACKPGRARALLDAVGLAAAADLHPEKASLGMQRRAAKARAVGTTDMNAQSSRSHSLGPSHRAWERAFGWEPYAIMLKPLGKAVAWPVCQT